VTVDPFVPPPRASDSPVGASETTTGVRDSTAMVPDALAGLPDGRTLPDPLGLPPRLAATLVLVRHGESTYIAEGRFQGRHDPALSPMGERQAALVAERLADPTRPPALPIPGGSAAAVRHSPLSRARRTAEQIAARQPLRVPLIADDAFTEIGQGDWEGLTLSEVSAASAETLAAWRRDPLRSNAPGGERLVDAAARVRAGLQRLVAGLAAQRAADDVSPVPGYRAARSEPWAVLVAHDGIFRLALLALLGLPLERFWSFPFVLCGISVVELRSERAALIAHNLAEHLAPLAAEAVAVTEERDRAGAL
jgi:broad specificity phosphatase PhoE